ncbi:MAG: hypothetical protein J6I31_01175 [Prevotella sp.]|jgi:hypothetical protein|nr:hypothetical protein [Prevotella sp.]
MANIDEELRLDQEEDAREAQYIMQSLPSDLKEKFPTDEILYLMDLIVEHYYESGILESNDEEIEIDLQQVAESICRKAKQEDNKVYDPADVFFVVQADLDFQEENL